MATDAPNVGHLILDGDRRRDAIHVAVAPVTADCELYPCDCLRFHPEGQTEKVRLAFDAGVGIVDPFLKRTVDKSQRFWMFLHPNTVTSLRHYWSHPAFSAQTKDPEQRPSADPEDSDSLRWLEAFAKELGIGVAELIEGATEYAARGDLMTEQGSDTWRDILSGRESEFWCHYAAVTGRSVEDPSANFFRCSC